jgi:hypothetical protein
MKEKRTTEFAYLWCALYSFVGIAFELLVVAVEGMIGIDTNNFTVLQNIFHWIITIIVWVIIGIAIIKISRKTTGFDIWEKGKKMIPWQYLAIVIYFNISIILQKDF